MAKKTKIKSEARIIAQSQADVEAAIAQIGEATRTLIRIEADMGDEVASIKERWEQKAEPIRTRVAALKDAVQGWCEANRAVLTRDGKVKFYNFTSGQVQWRMTPPAVVIRGIDAVLELCRKSGFAKFIRQKEELNREAMLAAQEEAARIPGVTFSQREEFIIEPFEIELSETK
jgi:phage host-nuclease inhibitor protein Gam